MKIRAAKETATELRGIVADVVIEAAKSEDGKQKNPRFSMTAYTGKPMRLWGWYNPVIVELSGLTIPNQSRPILLNHTNDPEYVLGQTDSIKIKDNNVIAEGEIMGVSGKAKEVTELAAKGFKWQVSIGASAQKVEFVGEDKETKVNGQTFKGPLNIVRASRLGEISFVALGADDDTSANIAAGQYFDKNFKELEMNKQELIKAILAHAKNTHTAAQLDGMDVEALKALQGSLGNATESAKPESQPDVVAEIRAKAADEVARISEIRAKCSNQPEIMAKAIREGWNVEKAELETLRANTPKVPGVIVANKEFTPSVVEAALCMSGGIGGNDLIKAHGFDEKTITAADRNFRRLGLQQILLEAAWANGYTGRHFGKSDGVIREILAYAMPQDIKAGFSTMGLSGILANTANKFLLQGFTNVESAWRRICSIRSVNDFKTVTSYRLTGAFEYDEVGPGGELKHGTISEDSMTIAAKTYGKMFAVTRTDLVNDDLGALTQLPRRIGRGAALKLNTVFWTAFLNNSTFFTKARGNYDEGTDTALGFGGLQLAQTLFLNQTDNDSKPLGMIPKILLVPTALIVAAEQLYTSLEIRDNTANTKTPTSNVFARKYEPVSSAYLSNSSLTGYSSTAWYLLGDPADEATIEVAFLNGKQEPTVESADADFNTLGIQMRGYHDFGVALKEYRAGVKMKGAQ